jgi:hypothetical protein
VRLEVAMPFEPSLDLRMLVSGIVVDDQMDVEMLRRLSVNPAQKFEPLLATMPPHALADHLAIRDVGHSERCRGTMALVVVRHGAGLALLHRQTRLRAVERLDRALFANWKHQRFVRTSF